MSRNTILERSDRPRTGAFAARRLQKGTIAAYLAEGLGTFGLVFAGCGAIMIDTLSHGTITHVGVGLVFGLIITVMIYAFGHISGAHFNPAVTRAGTILVDTFLIWADAYQLQHLIDDVKNLVPELESSFSQLIK